MKYFPVYIFFIKNMYKKNSIINRTNKKHVKWYVYSERKNTIVMRYHNS